MRNMVVRFKQIELDYVSMAKAYLTGLLGALTVFVVAHLYETKPNKIGTVNITGMVDEFIKRESAKHLSEQSLKLEVKRYGDLLESQLKQVARNGNIVLLPSEAVIAGGKDYTMIVRERITGKLRNESMLNVE